jgi:hypothetical protein
LPHPRFGGLDALAVVRHEFRHQRRTVKKSMASLGAIVAARFNPEYVLASRTMLLSISCAALGALTGAQVARAKIWCCRIHSDPKFLGRYHKAGTFVA